MFAKIFSQILDSTIAENWKHRHVFMDLLVLADVDGVVNMTVEAIARRTNVPLEMVREGIAALCEEDPSSQNREFHGRRLIPIEEGRDWGWRIVSYHHYRKIRDEEQRRQYHRDYYLQRTKPNRKKTKPKTIAKTKAQEMYRNHADHPGGELRREYQLHPDHEL